MPRSHGHFKCHAVTDVERRSRVLFTDDFNRTDAGSLGDNWTATSSILISGNQAALVKVSSPPFCATTILAHPDVTHTRVSFTRATSIDGGPMARQNGQFFYYLAAYTNHIEVWRRDGNQATKTQIGVTQVVSHVAGDKLGLEVRGDVNINVYVNDAVVYSVSDVSAGRLSGAGRTGLISFSSVGADNYIVEELLIF